MFYSDAFINIQASMVFVTDKKLVLYSDAWDPKEIIVPFSDIAEINAEYNESFIDDSVIWITTKDGDEYKALISSDGGGDKRFYGYLEKQVDLSESKPEDPTIELKE